MPSEIERIAFLEAKMIDLQETVNRLRNHVSELLTFKSSLEGSVRTIKFLMGFVGLSNIVLLIKLLAFAK